jgi:molecular chaperone GrpE
MDEQTKQRLISELRDHLDALPETPESVDSEDESPGSREIDLYSLFTELAGLRNEIRLESRQLKRALDEFGGVFSTLEDNSKRLGSELDARRASQAAATAKAERALLLELIELRDRLAQAHDLAAGNRPGAWARLFSPRQQALIQDMAEGLGITVRRLDQALARYDVAPIKAVGQTIDPHRMQVAAVRADPEHADGVALEEVRRGYQRADEVLRLAEVVANRRHAKHSDEIEHNL